MLDVFVLGSVRAGTSGCDYPLGGPKQRALLARLVIARGRSLSTERLVADLWDGFAPRDPAHALQARVSRLRSAVPVKIEWLDGGYRLDPAQVRTDAARFERLCQRGGVLLGDGDLSQAAECFHGALDLWHGQPFAGLLDITALRAESVRLEKLRAAALSDRIDLDLALGRSSEVIPELHALVEEHPFTERHWGQLMTALYCDGRMQEALDAFSRARSTFAYHLGVEPSSELGRLHMGILREQSPESLLRVPVAASVFGGPGDADTGEDELAERVVTSAQPDNLAALLRDRRSLLLTGPAGIGKTHLLRAIGTRFESRQCSAPLVTASPLSQAVPLGVFAGTLPQRWTSPAALIEHFTRHQSTTVLLVDNVDQLDEASLFVVGQLVRNSRLPIILAARDLNDAPEEIQALYDSGELTEIAVAPLSDAGCDEFVAHLLGGALTPDSRPRVFGAAENIPLHLREILTASLDEGRLVRTRHGWELRGAPVSTSRLARLVGERFSSLDDAALEAAVKVAIAGEYPASALEGAERRALARAGVVDYAAHGWLRLSHPLDGHVLRTRCSTALWRDLSHEVLQVLLSDATADRPAARRRGHILALDLGEPVDIDAMLAVAEHAFGAFDERLALRAAEAVTACDPSNAHAHRVAGLAASALGKTEDAAAHFETARRSARTAAEQTAVALAHARHLGLRHHDAAGALAVVQEALRTVESSAEGSDEADHLRRDATRWAASAGQSSEAIDAPVEVPDAVAALGLITVGASGVITGPLGEAEIALARLRRVPDEVIELVPGGASLIALTEIMALSNTGNVVATRRRLQQMISDAEVSAPESLGVWEYALGFTELLSGDVERAYELGLSASAHLEWRDTNGLLPAARALTGAAAQATGRTASARNAFDDIPHPAGTDPKVVMLRAWAEAWQENAEGRRDCASRRLVDTARWLLAAQHSYFAGMLAHCAVRIGRDLADAVAVLEDASQVAGGGLLDVFARHGTATVAGDSMELGTIALDARELGMATTAVDTWLTLLRLSDSGGAELDARHQRSSVEELRKETPAMALWAPGA